MQQMPLKVALALSASNKVFAPVEVKMILVIGRYLQDGEYHYTYDFINSKLTAQGQSGSHLNEKGLEALLKYSNVSADHLVWQPLEHFSFPNAEVQEASQPIQQVKHSEVIEEAPDDDLAAAWGADDDEG